jgi:hypothetical protein
MFDKKKFEIAPIDSSNMGGDLYLMKYFWSHPELGELFSCNWTTAESAV